MEKLYLEAWLGQRFLFFSGFGFFVLGIRFLRIIWQWPETDTDLKLSWFWGPGEAECEVNEPHLCQCSKSSADFSPHVWLRFSLRFYKGYRWDCSYSFSHPVLGLVWGACWPHHPHPRCEEWWEHRRECGLLVRGVDRKAGLAALFLADHTAEWPWDSCWGIVVMSRREDFP